MKRAVLDRPDIQTYLVVTGDKASSLQHPQDVLALVVVPKVGVMQAVVFQPVELVQVGIVQIERKTWRLKL